MPNASLASAPQLLYLGAEAVSASMPPLEERLALAELTMRALADGSAELPPKIAVHPRPDSSFAHAMPAFRRVAGTDAGEDLLGMKWVTGFPTNSGRGLPGIHGLLVLNDAATGVPTAILDAGSITAERTAAVSGIAIRRWGPQARSGARRVALIGAGVQGRSHLAVLAHLLPGVELSLYDVDAERAAVLAAEARRRPGFGLVSVAASARDAIDGADLVVTAAAFGPIRQVMTNDWLAPQATVVAIDYATYAAAEIAREASLFLVDERGQFVATRDAGLFAAYPDPTATIGEALIAGISRPEGRVLISHLGVGLADVVFGAAIVRAATAAGRGVILAR